MNFVWDSEKAKRNVAKHGVTFDEASTAFGDPFSLTIDDPDHSYGEQRLLVLGETYSGRLIVWLAWQKTRPSALSVLD
jgi:uncharacterized DUF497 family protein